MKILQINSVPYGSTCTIMLGIQEIARNKGIQVDTAAGYSYHPVALPKNHIQLGGFMDKSLHILLSYVTGKHGFFSKRSTYKLLRKIEEEKYDILHFHNLHGWYINLPLLFDYVKKRNIKIIWTLHDCWTFTGQCPYFTFAECEKWKTGCQNCPQYQKYPSTFFDNSNRMYQCKKEMFTGISDLTLVTPSQWLAGLVKQSFLKEYPVQVIHNGIDLSVFKHTDSDFRKRFHCEDKFILLGVAFGWEARKGLDVFIELSKSLDSSYQIVLVGVDKKTKKILPDNIIALERTQNQHELTAIYSTADVFVNPTREDNFPTVNIEALACGTPVITFKTGGSPETLDATCGSVVACGDLNGLIEEIKRVKNTRPYLAENCRKRAENFDRNSRFREYMDLYREIVNG